MAFPTGWNRRHKITIDNTKVSGTGDLTDFPVLLTEDNFLSDAFSHSDNGGGDLRFSSDSAGATQLPCEVVKWDTSASKAEIWVKRTLDGDADTDIYVWYDNSGQTQPGHTDTYGTHNVWNSSYQGVWHLEDSNYSDSTSNGYDLGAVGTPEQCAGKWGRTAGGMRLATGDTECVTLASASCGNLNIDGSHLYEWWVATNTSDTAQYYIGKGNAAAGNGSGVRLYSSSIAMVNYPGGGTLETSHNATSSWTWMVGQYVEGDANRQRMWINNDKHQQAATDFTGNNTADFSIGRYGAWTHANSYAAGDFDEARFVVGTLSDDWLTTEYNNQSSPSTFATESDATYLGNPDINVNHSPTATESVTVTTSAILINVNESPTATDTLTEIKIPTLHISSSDSPTATDVITEIRIPTLHIDKSETPTATEDVTVNTSALLINVSDTPTATEDVTVNKSEAESIVFIRMGERKGVEIN